MGLFIDWLANKIVSYLWKPVIRMITVIVFAAIVIVSCFWVQIAQEHDNTRDYICVSIDEFKNYSANLINDVISIDMIEIPTPSKKGVIVELGDQVNTGFVELHVKSGAVYALGFYDDNRSLGEIEISSIKSERLVIAVPQNIAKKGYNVIKLTPILGKMFGLGFIRLLDDYDDNIVLQELEDIGKINSSAQGGISEPFMIHGIDACLVDYSQGTLNIEILNIHDRNIILQNLENDDGQIICTFEKDTIIKNQTMDYEKFQFDYIDESLFKTVADVYVRYKIEGSQKSSIVAINPFKRFDNELYEATNVRITDNINEFDCVKTEGDKLFFEGDNITLSKALFIPKGFEVFLKPGQTFDLVEGAYIVSRSNIVAQGTSDDSILIDSSDSTGKGLFICQALQESKLSHVIFNNLSMPISGAWQLTGSVTFYESDVQMNYCAFQNNLCEDALNIVRSQFEIRNSVFKNTFADAFDSDFSSGAFYNTEFINSGNDAFDASTSTITLDGMFFDKIRDKAVSAGENSDIVISNSTIENSKIGIASKDSSRITGDNIEISDTEIGYTLYVKKPEFGGGYINITHSVIKGDIGIEYLIEPGSELWINQKYIEPKSASKESIFIEKMINGEPIT